MNAHRAYITSSALSWLAVCALLATGACEGNACSYRRASSQDYQGPSFMELMDIVQRYFYSPLRREDLEDEHIFKRLKATPQYQAWDARRSAAWDKRDEWRTLVVETKALLPDFGARDEAVPAMCSYEASVWRKDEPEPADGVVESTLIIRVSFFAPIYEMYESHVQLVAREPTGEPGDFPWRYKNRRRTHEISPRFMPAAEVFARAIEERYGYQRANPRILDIRLVNTAIWEEAWNSGTLREALFSTYRL